MQADIKPVETVTFLMVIKLLNKPQSKSKEFLLVSEKFSEQQKLPKKKPKAYPFLLPSSKELKRGSSLKVSVSKWSSELIL